MKYDKKHKHFVYVDDLVWLKEEEVSSFNLIQRAGPYQIFEKLSNLSNKLADTSLAQLGRRSNVHHVNKLEPYKVRDPRLKGMETYVREIQAHKREDNILFFKTLWANKSTTWEPLEQFFDIEDGKFIYNQKL